MGKSPSPVVLFQDAKHHCQVDGARLAVGELSLFLIIVLHFVVMSNSHLQLVGFVHFLCPVWHLKGAGMLFFITSVITCITFYSVYNTVSRTTGAWPPTGVSRLYCNTNNNASMQTQLFLDACQLSHHAWGKYEQESNLTTRYCYPRPTKYLCTNLYPFSPITKSHFHCWKVFFPICYFLISNKDPLSVFNSP